MTSAYHWLAQFQNLPHTRSRLDGLSIARSAVNTAKTLGDVIEEDGRSTTGERDTKTSHASAVGLLVKVDDLGIVDHATVVGDATKGRHGKVVLQPILKDTCIRARLLFVINTRSAANAKRWSKVHELCLGDQSRILAGLMVLARAEDGVGGPSARQGLLLFNRSALVEIGRVGWDGHGG